MAGGLFSSLRAHRSSSSSNHSCTTQVLLFLTFLPLAVAAFAFFIHWQADSATPYATVDRHFLAVDRHAPTTSSLSRTDCGTLLSHSSPSFPYFRNWEFHHQPQLKPNIAITTSTSASLDQILPWIFFHKVIGVTTFYLFAEGKAASPEISRVLESISGVKVIRRTKELEEQQARSRIWNETWLADFFYKPCNYELFVKQTLNMEMAIVMARNDGVDWVLHLDTDELVHPAGTREYSLREVLLNVPSDVDMVVFPNYESSVERDDIQDPFSEVSLFKKNYDHLPKDTYDLMYKEATRNNVNYFLTYGNGKAIARVVDNLRPNGAHRWYNYAKAPKYGNLSVFKITIKLGEAAVLHYTYAKFSALTSRRDRCNCKPTKEDLKRCFMLEFDRVAFIIASTATEEEMRQWLNLNSLLAFKDAMIFSHSGFACVSQAVYVMITSSRYREHIVWGDEELKLKLLQRGILTRIYAPMVIIQALRESGVFTSVIASASTNLSNNTSSSFTVNAANSSRASAPAIPSSKTSKSETRESQTTTRKVLEVSNIVQYTHQAAVPPLPAPVLQM
ncbi:hypothetical protein Cgig2_021736 [Carnegiea gigantea]|uniref:Glycosyltransferase family 92 protein n=1 Tax=Carnegiea gigantea TaxID=171969 RepID=A0A9Q1QB27_9CARY|nr:hypothetical protein Cgig2_021736 [Carnegiea gigantea]